MRGPPRSERPLGGKAAKPPRAWADHQSSRGRPATAGLPPSGLPAERLELLRRAFSLPTMAARCGEMLASAETQNWGYRKFLLQLCEAEAADRRERKQQRLLRESKLPAGKTLGNLAEGPKVRRQLPTLLEGSFVERAENVLVFGLPGRGKTHFLCALGRELGLRRG